MSSSVEQIKSRLNIVDIVASYIKLQKAGINLKALCPFHHEKTPSFFVSPARETWHCFGCNKGGDIFSFVMEIEGVEFPDALKTLADRAGVELKPVSQEYRTERSRLLQLLDEANRFYEAELNKDKKVLDYLKERGLENKTIKEFGIGFAPEGWRNLHSFLKTKGYSDSEIEKSGLIIKSEKGYYDRFRSRIMFPLNNSAGQIVGFSGRIFVGRATSEMPDVARPTAEPAKYINTPQTILYDKSKLLYGFDNAKTEIRKKDLCVLVEGQMDVIMSHQAGVKNAIAVSGTALTFDHLRIIKRLTENLAMAFDKDEAGFQASKRGIDMAISEGFEIKVIIIPAGKDPADAIKEDKKIWEKAVKNAKNIIGFYLEVLFEKSDDPRELKKKIRDLVLPYVAIIPDEIEKAHWVGEIAKVLNIKEEPIWEELRRIPKPASQVQEMPEPGLDDEKRRSRLDLLKERLIGFILWQDEAKDKELKKKMKECREKYNLKLNKQASNEKKFIFEAELCYSGVKDLQKELDKLMMEIEKENIKLEREEITSKIRQLEMSGKEENLIEYLNRFNDLNKKLKEL
ncbi:DNA primase [Patescibacteria group bacterium]|nr:DNA primase [Patescibacteria group bacterium]